MKNIEVGKTYKTRNGREVRIYALDGIGLQAIHGAIFEGTIFFSVGIPTRGTQTVLILDVSPATVT